MPINFIEVDPNRCDPNQQYYMLNGKIGELKILNTNSGTMLPNQLNRNSNTAVGMQSNLPIVNHKRSEFETEFSNGRKTFAVPKRS
jgi:hypothetical protein